MSSPSRTSPPKNSIGGTTATQILGMNKYGGKHSAYRKIVRSLEGLPDATPVNFQMYRGMICEDPVVQLIQDEFFSETGFFLGELFGSGVVRHADYPFIHATVDRLLVDGEGKFSGILEIKTAARMPGNERYWRRHGLGSSQHLTQIEHYVNVLESALPERIAGGRLTENYLLVAEADPETWSMAVPLIDINWVRCEFPGDYGDTKLKDLVKFWTSHIETRSPPEVDGSEDCTATIIDQIPLRTGEREINVEDDEHEKASEVVAEYDFIRDRLREIEGELDSYREEKKSLKMRQSEIKNRLSVLAGESSVIQSDEFRVKFSRSMKGRGFDSDKFRIEHPEEWARYQKEGRESERVTITRKK
jgi:predicted phage-related endonuclease